MFGVVVGGSYSIGERPRPRSAARAAAADTAGRPQATAA